MQRMQVMQALSSVTFASVREIAWTGHLRMQVPQPSQAEETLILMAMCHMGGTGDFL